MERHVSYSAEALADIARARAPLLGQGNKRGELFARRVMALVDDAARLLPEQFRTAAGWPSNYRYLLLGNRPHVSVIIVEVDEGSLRVHRIIGQQAAQ